MLRLEVHCFLISICFCASQAYCKASSSWKTLHGDAPLVVARGGFSGLLPDSSYDSYEFGYSYSSPDTALWCDVQLTKDNVGICYPEVTLENSSNIESVYGARRRSTYFFNGVHVAGWFPVDFTFHELSAVGLMRGILSRPNIFDALHLPIQTVHNLTSSFRHVWLNIQHDTFYAQHNLSMRMFVLSVAEKGNVDYISSPELQFVKDTSMKLNTSKTQLIFRFLGQNEKEPTTNQTYGSLLKNVTAIKKFASGILIPKEYIWPVDPSGYLLPHTSVVSDAHNAGLKVFASGFANDYFISYNYSYDPIEEYLKFIDNGKFSVDGILSDYPVTASAAIGCYTDIGRNASLQEKPLIISFEGSSGDYPGCTNLAYEKAISDGATVIDCPVQMTLDRIPICLGSINLINSTTVLQSGFSDYIISLPELGGQGIYTFNLTWDSIRTLKPQISNPFTKYNLLRNPKAKNVGEFLTLEDFLKYFGNGTSLSGIIISIENAAFMEIQGLDVTNAVIGTLSEAGLDNKSQTAKKVMIQSSSSSVLKEFKEKTNYNLVYYIDDLVEDVLNSTIQNIKSFADAVVLQKDSVYPSDAKYLIGETQIIHKFHTFYLPVYVKLYENEFVSQAWDFMSDSRMEINTFVHSATVDGIITSFPKTAAAYKRNKCLQFSKNETPVYMRPVKAGELIKSVVGSEWRPAAAPLPCLTDADVNEAPLPCCGNYTGTPVAEADEKGEAKWSLLKTILLAVFGVIFVSLGLSIWWLCRRSVL